jgi:uncharacterized membrane protein
MNENNQDINFNERQLKRIFYRRLAVVVWVSFLVAAVQTMAFFAAFDPELMGQLATFSVMLTAIQGYTIGFLFFWVFNLITAVLVGIVMVLPRTKLAKRTSSKAE